MLSISMFFFPLSFAFSLHISLPAKLIQPMCLLKQKNGENYKSIAAFYDKVFILNVVSLVKDIGSTEAPKQVPEADNGMLPLFSFFDKTIHRNKFSVPLVDICPKTPPQPSPFPRIPDISPKKVSPSQNVYLSPLKPSKASKFCPVYA